MPDEWLSIEWNICHSIKPYLLLYVDQITQIDNQEETIFLLE